jgi:hypothetical protein
MMTDALIAIGIAVAVVTLMGCLQLRRSPKRRAGDARSGSAGDNNASDGISDFAWSTDVHSPSHHSAAASDAGDGAYSGGGDGGASGDGGGGGGGDGGGGGGGSD